MNKILIVIAMSWISPVFGAYCAEDESRPDQIQIPNDCWYCIPCNKKFFDLGSLNKHIKHKHKNSHRKTVR